MTAVFLCCRLADYFYQCVSHFAITYQVQCVVLTTPADSAAPFQFEETDNLKIMKVEEKAVAEWIGYFEGLKPELIYISGWAEKRYKPIAKHFRDKTPVIMGFDAQWRATFKQYVGILAAPFVVMPYCNKLWIAGLFQFEFARKLGFEKNQIIQGVYSANTRFLHQQYEALRINYRPKKEKILLFVGRLISLKNLHFLIETFQTLSEVERNGWKIVLVGAGPLKADLQQISKENITFKDFVKPQELPALFAQSDAFCLPSYYDQWGVVVHEAAAMGLPLLISEVCGAIATFLIEGYNGYSFSPYETKSLRKSLVQLFQHTDEELISMGKNSHQLSYRITLDTWAGTLMGVMNS